MKKIALLFLSLVGSSHVGQAAMKICQSNLQRQLNDPRLKIPDNFYIKQKNRNQKNIFWNLIICDIYLVANVPPTLKNLLPQLTETTHAPYYSWSFEGSLEEGLFSEHIKMYSNPCCFLDYYENNFFIMVMYFDSNNGTQRMNNRAQEKKDLTVIYDKSNDRIVNCNKFGDTEYSKKLFNDFTELRKANNKHEDDQTFFDMDEELPNTSPTTSHSSVKSLSSSSSLSLPDATPLTPQTPQNKLRKSIVPIAQNKN